uniref:Uncharacterized protein n=1 Tax=Anguilla anguilla TaxID=7936 RepID=A0A0E9TJH8_ANGAN
MYPGMQKDIISTTNCILALYLKSTLIYGYFKLPYNMYWLYIVWVQLKFSDRCLFSFSSMNKSPRSDGANNFQ